MTKTKKRCSEAELWKKWKMTMDEDLTIKVKRIRWRMKKRARLERREGKEIVVENRKM